MHFSKWEMLGSIDSSGHKIHHHNGGATLLTLYVLDWLVLTTR